MYIYIHTHTDTHKHTHTYSLSLSLSERRWRCGGFLGKVLKSQYSVTLLHKYTGTSVAENFYEAKSSQKSTVLVHLCSKATYWLKRTFTKQHFQVIFFLRSFENFHPATFLSSCPDARSLTCPGRCLRATCIHVCVYTYILYVCMSDKLNIN